MRSSPSKIKISKIYKGANFNKNLIENSHNISSHMSGNNKLVKKITSSKGRLNNN